MCVPEHFFRLFLKVLLKHYKRKKYSIVAELSDKNRVEWLNQSAQKLFTIHENKGNSSILSSNMSFIKFLDIDCVIMTEQDQSKKIFSLDHISLKLILIHANQRKKPH